MRITTKKGFTLINCLLSLLIVSSLLFISSFSIKEKDYEDKLFPFEYLDKQTEAIANYTETSLMDIHFNSKGGVNKANTKAIGNKLYIIHLGTGYLSEK